ncbi:MAG TPA: hypothetical protein DDZ76_07870 [Xanthomonadales bacterium]|nr:hypothetical protein [Xanthomonadales bacterium]
MQNFALNDSDPEPATPTPTPAPRTNTTGRQPRPGRWLMVALVLTIAILALLAFRPGSPLSAWLPGLVSAPGPQPPTLDQRVERLEATIADLRDELTQQTRRQSETAAALRVAREELFGVRDRAALLEDAIERASERARQAEHLLRLDEAELLLSLGQQRLLLADDLDSALHAYALAAQSLAQLADPAFVTLRQSLDQELAALRTLRPDRRIDIGRGLDAIENEIPTLPHPAATRPAGAEGSRLTRLLDRLVQVRPITDDTLIRTDDRSTAETALGLHFALARLALASRDGDDFARALNRIDAWLVRLYPDSLARQALRSRLRTLADSPLNLDLPLLGSTLEQLRQQPGTHSTPIDPADRSIVPTE